MPDGSCYWIGASTWNSGSEIRWMETPPNYNQPDANGELLTNTYSNFLPGKILTYNYSCMHFSIGINPVITDQANVKAVRSSPFLGRRRYSHGEV